MHTKSTRPFNLLLIIPMIAAILACSLLEPVPTPTQIIGPTLIVVNPSPASNPFVGAWLSVDTDGSNQELIISEGSGATLNINYTDFGASACGKDSYGTPIYAATAAGSLTATGNVLTGNLPIYCQKNSATLLVNHDFYFTLDPATGRLTDSFGVVWNRK